MDTQMNDQVVILCLCFNVLQIKLKLPVIVRGPFKIQCVVVNNRVGSFITCICLEFVAELAYCNAISINTIPISARNAIYVPIGNTPILNVSHDAGKEQTLVIEDKLSACQRAGKTF